MAVFRDIDCNTRINGSLNVALSSTFSQGLIVVGILQAGNIIDVETAINSKLSSSGGTLTGDLTVTGNLTIQGSIVGGGGLDTSQYYTKTELNTSGSSAVHWGNLTNIPPDLVYEGGAGSLTLGETSTTAYRGDYGKIAYDHSQTTHAPSDAPSNSTFTGHTSDTTIHIISTERTAWNLAKSHADLPHAPSDAPSNATFTGHTNSTTIHITEEERTSWNSKQTTLGYTPLKNTTDTLIGTLTITDSANPLKLVAGSTLDQVYIELYADSQAQTTRSGWIGYAPAGTTQLGIKNEMTNGDISLLVAGTGKVKVGSNEIWHAGNFNPSNYLPITGGTVNSNLTISGTLATGVITTTNGNRIINLNADKLDDFHSVDIFNSVFDTSGYGVMSGCKVNGLGTQKGISIAAGKIYIKDYGTFIYPGKSAITGSAFTEGYYHIIFIAGKTESSYTLGSEGIISATSQTAAETTFKALTNAIKLAVIPNCGSTISDSDIVGMRRLIPIKTVIGNPNTPSKISILESDRDNVRINTGNYQTIERLTITSSGDNTIFTLSDIPTIAGVVKTIEIKSDTITFNSDQTSKTITATKINDWDDAVVKEHTHYYNAAYSGPTVGAGDRSYITINTYVPLVTNTRVYKNGLRLRNNTSSSAWDNDYWQSGNTITFSGTVTSDDIIIVDFDM